MFDRIPEMVLVTTAPVPLTDIDEACRIVHSMGLFDIFKDIAGIHVGTHGQTARGADIMLGDQQMRVMPAENGSFRWETKYGEPLNLPPGYSGIEGAIHSPPAKVGNKQVSLTFTENPRRVIVREREG